MGSTSDKASYFAANPLRLATAALARLPYFRFLRETSDYQCRVGFGFWFCQRVLNLGGNRGAYWPVHWSSTVFNPERIVVGIDAYPGIMKGCYIQGKNGIFVGDYTQIGPGVAIVSANHDEYDSRRHLPCEPVSIGRYCWLGAGAKVLPGVTLGDWTIVGAGAVVTRSFEDGYCVIAGVPARRVRELDRQKCVPFHNKVEFNGYVESAHFEAYRRENLKI